MNLTEEQQKIIDAVLDDSNHIIKISARAGSGKTAILAEISRQLGTSGIYLAYNKSIATEAQAKFSNKIQCSTIHSLAYRYTVKQRNLKLGYFGYRDIKEYIPFVMKVIVLDIIKLYLSSKYIKFDDFVKDRYYEERRHIKSNFSKEHKNLFTIANKYVSRMFSGLIPITHDGYLKMFHVLLASDDFSIEYPLIMIDEAGDLVPVTYEIFKLIKADKKIIAGDEYQTIYTFNNTINAFAEDNDGIMLEMTKSFRCNENVAKLVQAFMQRYVDPKFRFIGTSTVCDNDIETEAYISRTNSALIEKIIASQRNGIPFNMTRDPKQIFDLTLALIYLSPDKKITIPDYLYINDEMDNYWNDDFLQDQYSPLEYIYEKFGEEDPAIKIAITNIGKLGPKNITDAFNYAKDLYSQKIHNQLTITTAHACKGLEFDTVYIDNDMNTTIEKVLKDIEESGEMTESHRAELLLYYVACSRAKKILVNAVYAERAYEELLATRLHQVADSKRYVKDVGLDCLDSNII